MKNSNGFTSYFCIVLAIIIACIVLLSTLKSINKRLSEVNQQVIKSSFVTVPVR